MMDDPTAAVLDRALGGPPPRRGLRVRLVAPDVRRHDALAALLRAHGHRLVETGVETGVQPGADVQLIDGPAPHAAADAPVLLLADTPPPGPAPSGLVPPDIAGPALDAALRAVASGLLVRAPDLDGAARLAPEPLLAPPLLTPSLLTPRELEILGLIGDGLSNKAIARRLAISAHTVKFHLESVFTKLQAGSRAEAVVKGLRRGMIEL